MSPNERSRKALEGVNVRQVLEASNLPVEIATAIADALETVKPEVCSKCGKPFPHSMAECLSPEGPVIPGAIKLAVMFHETYERLAPEYGYETKPETRVFDATTPNGKLMIAVCGEMSRRLRKPQLRQQNKAVQAGAEEQGDLRPGNESSAAEEKE